MNDIQINNLEIESNKVSIANLKKEKKYPLYEKITVDNLSSYFDISCYPITKIAG